MAQANWKLQKKIEIFFTELKKGNFNFIDEYINKNNPLDIYDTNEGEYPLHTTIKKIKEFEAFIGNSDNSDVEDEDENIEKLNDFVYIFRRILDNTSPNFLNIPNANGQTLLMLSAELNERLINSKRDKNNQYNIFSELYNKGALPSLFAVDNLQKNIFHYIAKNKNFNVAYIEFIKKQNHNNFITAITSQDRLGNTPIHIAIISKNNVAIYFFNSIKNNKQLLKNIIELENKNKKSPFSIAIQNNYFFDVLNSAEQKIFLSYLEPFDQALVKGEDLSSLKKPGQHTNIQTQNLDDVSILILNSHGNEVIKSRKEGPKNKNMMSIASCGIMTRVNENGFTELVTDIKANKNKKEFYANIVKNKKAIEQTLKLPEMRLYTEGYPYPNFNFGLLSNFNEADGINFGISGVIPYEVLHLIPLYNNGEIGFKIKYNQINFEFFNEFLPRLFKYSIYPTSEEVKAYFKDLNTFKQNVLKDLAHIFPTEIQYSFPDFEQDLNLFYIEKFYILIAKNISEISLFQITYDELLKTNGEKPMVLYNMVCRGLFDRPENVTGSTSLMRLVSETWQQQAQSSKKNKNSTSKLGTLSENEENNGNETPMPGLEVNLTAQSMADLIAQ